MGGPRIEHPRGYITPSGVLAIELTLDSNGIKRVAQAAIEGLVRNTLRETKVAEESLIFFVVAIPSPPPPLTSPAIPCSHAVSQRAIEKDR